MVHSKQWHVHCPTFMHFKFAIREQFSLLTTLFELLWVEGKSKQWEAIWYFHARATIAYDNDLLACVERWSFAIPTKCFLICRFYFYKFICLLTDKWRLNIKRNFRLRRCCSIVKRYWARAWNSCGINFSHY